MNIHEKYIKRCIEIAKLAEGKVSPNPLVGSVVLDKDGNFVSEGYHEKYGEPHAEINALTKAEEKATGGTIYISLEPCSHYGKTPPCADRIITSGVKTVVTGMTDPNPKVSGNGIRKLREAGIEVITDVLKPECIKLNEIFIKNITQGKPFIAVKTASTADGKIAASSGSSKWITSETARGKVQDLRNRYDAILTGSGTVLKDNPSLNCRKNGGRNPVRVIVDSQLLTSPESKVYLNDNTEVFIAISENMEDKKLKNFPSHIEFIRCPVNSKNKIDLVYLTENLYKKRIFSIMTEGGGKLNGAFLQNNLVDKIYLFIAPKILGDSSGLSSFEGFSAGQISDCINLRFENIISFPPDLLIEGYLK